MKSIYAIAMLGITLASCSTYRLETSQLSGNYTPNLGELVYFSPKTLLSIKVTYFKTIKIKYIDGIGTEEAPEFSIKDIEVSPVTVNDADRQFLAKGNEKALFFMRNNTNIRLSGAGVLQSVQSELEDKSLQTFESVLKGAGSIVKTIAMAGTGNSVMIGSLNKKITAAQTRLITAIAKKDKKQIAAIKEEITEYYALLKVLEEKNKTVEQITEVLYSQVIDPQQGTQTIDGPATITVDITRLSSSKTAVIKTNFDQTTKTVPGILYTVPDYYEVQMKGVAYGKNQIVFRQSVAFPQFGSLACVPVSSKSFTTKKTSIEFDPITGTLVKLDTEHGAPSEALAKSFENSASMIKTTLYEMKYDQKIDQLKKDKEIKDLKASLTDQLPTPKSKLDSLQTDLELLKAQLEIEKIKKQIKENQ
ncbi:hypothetical protein [Pedobacter alluvionis]|uniref:Pesticin immunity protein n=1 Tax=Pedobacter alluvionis TaxID=475253 RepID=A0A497XLJ1_9SPHI|nr:hypothetical protein [Pedobacter alluvionis]RLJ69560.1 pesticin immunity protein [Pedobacter alluvionis]TFB28377.1 hypothetical protein E3V97_23125 [Pedobacter alluvionis]